MGRTSQADPVPHRVSHLDRNVRRHRGLNPEGHRPRSDLTLLGGLDSILESVAKKRGLINRLHKPEQRAVGQNRKVDPGGDAGGHLFRQHDIENLAPGLEKRPRLCRRTVIERVDVVLSVTAQALGLQRRDVEPQIVVFPVGVVDGLLPQNVLLMLLLDEPLRKGQFEIGDPEADRPFASHNDEHPAH